MIDIRLTEEDMISIERLRQLKLIDEKALRDLNIQLDCKELKEKRYKVEDIKYMLADKYFVSPQTIEAVIYGLKKKSFLLE